MFVNTMFNFAKQTIKLMNVKTSKFKDTEVLVLLGDLFNTFEKCTHKELNHEKILVQY